MQIYLIHLHTYDGLTQYSQTLDDGIIIFVCDKYSQNILRRLV